VTKSIAWEIPSVRQCIPLLILLTCQHVGAQEPAAATIGWAIAIGQRDPGAYRTETALDPLRGRDDFRALMRDLAMLTDPFASPR
jgi:hypothetical protein